MSRNAMLWLLQKVLHVKGVPARSQSLIPLPRHRITHSNLLSQRTDHIRRVPLDCEPLASDTVVGVTPGAINPETHTYAQRDNTVPENRHGQGPNSDWLDATAFDFLGDTDHPFGQSQFTPFDFLDEPYTFGLVDGVGHVNSINTPTGVSVTSHSPARSQMTLSDDRFAKVAHFWPRTRPAPRLARSMWRDLAKHRGREYYSYPGLEDPSFPTVASNMSQAYPEYCFDDSCYQRLIHEFGCLVPSAGEGLSHAVNGPGVLSHQNTPGDNSSETPSNPGRIRFPSREVFAVSVGLYFRRFHALFPLIHEPTFKARDTSTSLLFTICLIGLCYLGDEAAKRFVHLVAPGTVVKVIGEVAAVAARPPGSLTIVASLRSSALLMCLATILSEFANSEGIRNLYMETITIVQRLGLFAEDSDNTLRAIEDELGSNVDSEEYWRIWARIESAKRLIVCLIMCDAFYAHSFDVHPVIRSESMAYYLPSDKEIFEAPNATKWKTLTGTKPSLLTPLFVIRRGHAVIPSSPSSFAMHALLATIWIRESEVRHQRLGNKLLDDVTDTFHPYQFQSDDPATRDVGILLLDFYATLGSTLETANPNFLASWNNLCMSLTADRYFFEIAAGRAGPRQARAAHEQIGIWSQTAGARRACLHAAQTFAVMSKRKTSDGTTFHSEMALFASALVLGLFLSTSSVREAQANAAGRTLDNPTFELLDDVDWNVVGSEGLPITPTQEHTVRSASASAGTECAARAFIKHGKHISFAGKIHLGGFDAARRIFLEYAGLLEDVGRWNLVNGVDKLDDTTMWGLRLGTRANWSLMWTSAHAVWNLEPHAFLKVGLAIQLRCRAGLLDLKSTMAFPHDSLNVRAFRAAVAEETLLDFKQLLKSSRIGPQTYENSTHASPPFGVSRSWVQEVREYWLTGYDWRKTEVRINSFDNFQATLHDQGGTAFDLHFIALRSRRKDAVPVVLLHGWPGSPLEFLDMLDLARHKYSLDELPYTFIVPSLPGYGYSGGPSLEKPSTCDSMAFAVNQLMVGLGYNAGYVAQGGDIGSLVARVLAARYPVCKAAHINFALMAPPASIAPDSIDESEVKGLERAQAFNTHGDAYAREHGQRPATIGLLLSTSPLALLIWIGEKFLEWPDEPLKLDHILDNVTLYWFTETFPRSIYPYRQFSTPTTDEPTSLGRYIDKPLGYSWFPKEITPVPTAWVRTLGNLVWHKQHTTGGHFAALENPQALFQDLQDFIAAVWK